ncbi:uncharacterized protein LJ206_018603 [Theristicus caerulescens]
MALQKSKTRWTHSTNTELKSSEPEVRCDLPFRNDLEVLANDRERRNLPFKHSDLNCILLVALQNPTCDGLSKKLFSGRGSTTESGSAHSARLCYRICPLFLSGSITNLLRVHGKLVNMSPQEPPKVLGLLSLLQRKGTETCPRSSKEICTRLAPESFILVIEMLISSTNI